MTCAADVVQQCTEAQAVMVQDGWRVCSICWFYSWEFFHMSHWAYLNRCAVNQNLLYSVYSCSRSRIHQSDWAHGCWRHCRCVPLQGLPWTSGSSFIMLTTWSQPCNLSKVCLNNSGCKPVILSCKVMFCFSLLCGAWAELIARWTSFHCGVWADIFYPFFNCMGVWGGADVLVFFFSLFTMV